MKGTETPVASVASKNHDGQFTPARDYRNRRVKGLQVRNGRFYALLWTLKEDGRKGSRRFPLFDESKEPCRSLVNAQKALEILRTDRREGNLPSGGRKPGLTAAVQEYLHSTDHTSKAENTRDKEVRSLDLWTRHLGWETRIDAITQQMISGFKSRRLTGGKIGGKELKPSHPRTVHNDFVAFRNFLRYAKAEKGWIKTIPEFPEWKRKEIPKPKRRALIEPEKFKALIECCRAKHEGALGEDVPTIRNGEQLADFLLLLAYTGAREQEGLKLRWSHVDFENRCLHIGAGEDFVSGSVVLGTGGDTKTGNGREIEFNPQLEAHLKDMVSRRAPDSEWLFPSPRRGKKDLRVTTLRGALASGLKQTKIAKLGFHDMRHLFCSYCIMGGTPILDVAKWLGHRDGGRLIGTTYGHLLKDHLHEEAAKVQIGLSVVPRSAAVA